jgi:hypothetical protein
MVLSWTENKSEPSPQPGFRTTTIGCPMMGVSRYSAIPSVRRRQQLFDDLQDRCWIDFHSPKIGELLDCGIVRAHREYSGRSCAHRSDSFDVSKFGRNLCVRDLRWNYVCGDCGKNRPHLRLEWTG